jgi:cytochrome c peroxidase
MTMNMPLAHALTASVLVLASVSASAATPAELRSSALKVLAPLPEKMPGSENDTPARVKLGRELFFEKKLSANNTQSCNSCHAVDKNRGGVDNEPTSPGAFGKRGGRNSPTVLNAGFHVAQFWDGRAKTLEDQAKGPVLNPGEMAMPSEAAVIERLKAEKKYVAGFKKAFPGEAEPITYDNFAKAVGSFERTLRTHDRFDDFLKGDDKALTAAELKGLDTFLTIGCTTCHAGPLLGGNDFKKLGILNAYENTSDKGRIEVTKEDYDEFVFKVPSLRNIALTAPYFHDGTQKTLEQTVQKMAWLQLGKKLSDQETSDLTAFLRALSDKKRAVVASK